MRRAHGRAHRAVRFAQVPAVGEAALRRKRLDLDEAQRRGVQPIDRRREIAHPRRVDDLAAAGQLVQAGGGGGVAALVVANQLADRRSLSGTSARSSEDLPTPDWPTSIARLFAQQLRAAASSAGGCCAETAGSDSRRRCKSAQLLLDVGIDRAVPTYSAPPRRRCRRSARRTGSDRRRRNPGAAAVRPRPAAATDWRRSARRRRARWCGRGRRCAARPRPRRARRGGHRVRSAPSRRTRLQSRPSARHASLPWRAARAARGRACDGAHAGMHRRPLC